MANLPSHGDNMSNKKDHATRVGIIIAKPVEPQKFAQDLWAARIGQGGFKSERFPPINCKSFLAAALQLLYIASPEECLSLAKPYGSAWDLDEDHPAMRIHRNWSSWEELFELLMAPEPHSITVNAFIMASQPFVKPTQLPEYFTIGMPHLVGQTLRCQRFPEKDYLVRFLTGDGSLAATRMRWVGGIYRIGGGSPRVVFDWGDSDRSVGMSFNADWANHPPQRYSRPMFYSLIRSVVIAADLMISRRVETGLTEGLNHSARG